MSRGGACADTTVLGEVSGRRGVDQRTVQLALDEIQNSAWSLPYYLTALGYIFGLLILAVGAARSGLIAPFAAGLLIVAVLMTGTETMIVSNAYFIAGAALMLVAGVAVALSLRRLGESGHGPPADRARLAE